MENREPEKSNPNHRKVFYFLNILFMCMITAASLAMTVILFVRLERLRSEKQVEGSIYTDSQIEKIRYGAAQAERNRLLLEIQSSFESGNSTSTISMLRNLFPGDLVVMWEGRYYFYPVDRNLQTNPFSETDFAQGEKGGMEYIGEDAGVSVNRGVDVSALNGEINWAKVAEEQIAFAMIRAAVRNADGELVQDERFQENMSGAKSVGLRIGCLCGPRRGQRKGGGRDRGLCPLEPEHEPAGDGSAGGGARADTGSHQFPERTDQGGMDPGSQGVLRQNKESRL